MSSFEGPRAREEATNAWTTVLAYIEALRPHQWAKNVLVFLPLLAAHEVTNLPLVGRAVLAFVALSLCASSTYVVNDIIDLDSDRTHPRKRERPFASGRIPVSHGPLVALVPFVTGIGLAWYLLPPTFLLILGLYLVTSLAYSLYLKRILLVDVVVLAGLYTIRIIAGGTAVSITPSFWLLAFSMFLFLSLAMVKRYSELLEMEEGRSYIPGRGYMRADLETLGALGASGGYLAVLVLALYVNSEEVSATYRHPEAIWLVCPLLLYWVSRVWVVAGRGRMHDDPLVFALKDRVTLMAGLLAVLILTLAV